MSGAAVVNSPVATLLPWQQCLKESAMNPFTLAYPAFGKVFLIKSSGWLLKFRYSEKAKIFGPFLYLFFDITS